MRNKISSHLTAAICFIALILSGCDSISSNQLQEEAPPLISEKMFTMDLELFDNQEGNQSANKQVAHFFNAALRVVFVNHVVHSLLRIPFAATVAVQQVDPILEQGAFIWETEIVDAGSTYVLRLEARSNSNEIEWSMYVDGYDDEQDITYQNFLLYRVYSNPNSDSGRFELYYPHEGETLNVLNGVYEDKEGDDYLLQFSSPAGVDSIGGFSATYEEEGNWFSLDVQNTNDGTSTLIFWNKVTHEGSIEASDYNNGEKGCWDMFLRDAACSVAS